jgi:para-nitrobenzyl esterase
MTLYQGLLGALLLVCAGANTAQASIESATVTGGGVKGQVIDGVGVFRGIPFAAAPVGDLRWQVPRPVVAWQGVRNANAFAPACMQPWSPADQPQPSEDCLYLNVWTAAASAVEHRPVIVWIHGGGLVGGMSWEKVSDGTHLAREGAVVVTIAYRLGALGFLAHPELTRENGKTSGNYGLHDMIAALEWVQQNIAQFGGDSERVLVIGGSAGALAISVLAASPSARGLYSRAAALGGAAFVAGVSDDPKYVFYYPMLKHAEEKGAAMFKELGAPDSRAARALTADAVLKATDRGMFKFGIIRDGELVQGYNRELFQQGRFNDVPTLIGYTSDEAGDPPPGITKATAEADLKKTPCKYTHAAIVAAYPPLLNDQQTRAIMRQLTRDQNVGWSTWTWARLQTQHGRSPVYAHFFDIHPPDRPHGAPHATEYRYFFGNFLSAHTQRDLAASAMIRRYIINFAAAGDPNGVGLPHWEQFSEARQRVMVFDENSRSREWPNLAALKAFTPLLECFAGIPLPVAVQR